MKLLVPALLAVMVWFSVSQAMGAGPYEDVPVGALPAESVKAALQKTLSPQGRFVILATNGTVRIFDTPQKIAEARTALETLQNAPAIVSFAIIIKTGMHMVTKSASTGDDYGGVEFPVPNNYAPPQVAQYGHGVVVTPATPRNFHPHQVGYGGYVYQGGYVTGVEVNTQETGLEGGVLHRFEGSTVFPKPAAVTVCTKVPEPAALHDWAVKNGAVKENEPPWAAARTEILVTPERTADGMVLNLLPQIVVAGADGSPRLIPLRVCATSVTIKQGVPATFEGFPGADADFYRVFLGAQESTGDALSSVTVGALVAYVTQQPDKK